MINSTNINSSIPPTPPTPPRLEQSLTEEQQVFISDTLAEFNTDNLIKEDALSIMEAFSQTNIQPSAALEKAVSNAGFDAKNIGGLANVSQGNRLPPPPRQSAEEITSLVDYLAEILEKTLAAHNGTDFRKV
jgi:hypothetical protein